MQDLLDNLASQDEIIQRTITVVAAFLGFWVFLQVVRFIISKKIKRFEIIVRLIDKLGWPFYLTATIYLVSRFFEASDMVINIINVATLIILSYYVVRFILELIDTSLNLYIEKNKAKDEKFDSSVLGFFSTFVKLVVWVIAGIMVLQNLGYNVSALLGGLGIMGIAIGFAMQNVLGDIFSYISIYFDEPFKTGDFIKIDPESSGKIEHIGIKSTRIRTLHGEELVIPNAKLTSAQINNFHSLERRRVLFTLGVVYETPTKKLRAIKKIVEKIISSFEDHEFDRIHLKDFADFALIYEVVYHVNKKSFEAYIDAREEINLQILEAFEKGNIRIAYPTQKVFVENTK